MPEPRAWDRLLSEEERAVYTSAGYGQKAGLGQRPALLVVDVTYDFTGDRPEPILESIKRFHYSCGQAAWTAMGAIAKLQAAARDSGVPVIFTRGAEVPEIVGPGASGRKNSRVASPASDSRRIGRDIPDLVAPRPGEIVIDKDKPSGFFGSPLAGYLVALRVDSLLIVGGTTSGCVRATVIDAFSFNYRVAVVEEGTFDRGATSHAINLFDMQSKYADVISLDEALRYLASVDRAEV